LATAQEGSGDPRAALKTYLAIREDVTAMGGRSGLERINDAIRRLGGN
jgi:hypothetical protein